MIRAAIFDLNGVFIQSPKLSDRFASDFGVTAEKFIPALKQIMSEIRRPEAGDAYLYWEPYLEKWGIQLDRDKFFAYWFESEREVPEMIEIAKLLKHNNIKLFILSNNFSERANYYKNKFPFINEIFDEVYYSWQTGFTKDDPEAYRNVLVKNNLRPEECLYLDDSEDNVRVAKGLGIQAFKFDNIMTLKKVINSVCQN